MGFHIKKKTLRNIKQLAKFTNKSMFISLFETEFHVAQGKPHLEMELRSLTNGMTISFSQSLLSLLITFSQYLGSVGKLHLNLPDDFPGLILIDDDNLINQSHL